jgi:thiol-disulfide isomerase/thioredoxin
MIAPIFAGLARKYPDVLFIKVDSDKVSFVCQLLRAAGVLLPTKSMLRL